MPNTYDAGETVILQAAFKNSGGTLSTPETQTLYIERPDGDVQIVPQASLTVPGAGTLQYVDTASGYGTTWYRFVGITGGMTVTEQSYYTVRKQHAVGTALALAEIPDTPVFRITLSSPDGQVAHTVEAHSDDHANREAEVLAQRLAEARSAPTDEVGRTLARREVNIDSVERI